MTARKSWKLPLAGALIGLRQYTSRVELPTSSTVGMDQPDRASGVGAPLQPAINPRYLRAHLLSQEDVP